MNALKRFLLELKKREFKSNAVYKTWNSIQSILLIFQSDELEKNSEVKHLIANWREEGKNVVALQYVDKKHSIQPTLDNFIVMDRSSLTWKGSPRLDNQPLIDEQYFDVIIDLTEHELLMAEYALINIEAGLRCGRKRSDDRLHDFMIDMPPAPIDEATGEPDINYCFASELAEQIVKYLKCIK